MALDSITTPLPTVPQGYNPFEYWALFANLYSHPSPGFGTRLIVLLCLVAYSIIASCVLFGLHVTDYRRRKKEFWLWRLVKGRDRSARFLVGNQHLLGPLLTMLTASVFIGYIHDEYVGMYKHGSLSQRGAWNLAPWSALFLEQWIISWASLQSFILVSADKLPSYLIMTSNVTFVSIGVMELGSLVSFIVIGAKNGQVLWRVNRFFLDFLAQHAQSWQAGDVIAQDIIDEGTTLYSIFTDRVAYSLTLTTRVLILFSVSALLAAVVNLGALGTVLLVRRQIKFGYSTFAGIKTAHSIILSEELNSQPAPLTGDPSSSHVPSLGVAVIPPTPALPSTDAMVVSPQPSRAGSMRSGIGGSGSNTPSRAPSRARVRAMAAGDNGIRRERAKNLQRLQRAETDLLITGSTGMFMSLGLAGLGLYTIILIPHYFKATWVQQEVVLLCGTWLYSIVSAVSVSLHCHNAWINLSSVEPVDVEQKSPEATPAISPVFNPEHQPNARGEFTFEGMLNSGPNTPSHEKKSFNFGRRASAVSFADSQPPAIDEKDEVELDLGALNALDRV